MVHASKGTPCWPLHSCRWTISISIIGRAFGGLVFARGLAGLLSIPDSLQGTASSLLCLAWLSHIGHGAPASLQKAHPGPPPDLLCLPFFTLYILLSWTTHSPINYLPLEQLLLIPPCVQFIHFSSIRSWFPSSLQGLSPHWDQMWHCLNQRDIEKNKFQYCL